MANENAAKVPTVINPTVDLGELLALMIRDTGGLQDMMGGYKIKVYHTGAFPWDEVFKALLFREFKVYVTRHKADLFIEATP
jgi:hypothetical protein